MSIISNPTPVDCTVRDTPTSSDIVCGLLILGRGLTVCKVLFLYYYQYHKDALFLIGYEQKGLQLTIFMMRYIEKKVKLYSDNTVYAFNIKLL